MKKILERYEAWWQLRIDGSTLALFRSLFGLFLVCDGLYFLTDMHSYFASQKLYFSFPFFSWWPHFTEAINQGFLVTLIICGTSICLGFKTRFFSFLSFLLQAHLLLFDATMYLNHLVLNMLLSFVLIFISSDRYLSFEKSSSRQKDTSISRFELFSVIGLFWISYVYSAIEKIRPEWFSGDILAANIAARAQLNEYAHWALSNTFLLQFLAAGAWVLELFAPLLLIWKKTRPWAIAALLSFHIINHFAFNIGLFSLLMIFSFSLYWDPRQAKKFVSKWDLFFS